MKGKKAQVWAQQMLEALDAKLDAVRVRSCKKVPARNINGVHNNKADGAQYPPDDGVAWWTNGFWAGVMWLQYRRTKQLCFAQTARFTESVLDESMRKFTGLHHDVGFMWLPSCVADYRLTGRAEARDKALHAASLLMGRFNPAGFLRAWNDIPGQSSDTRGWVIIDSMLNIPLLYWASDETGDPRYKAVACIHADTVLRNFIRADGSVRHIVELSVETGEFKKEYGGQGMAEGSAWTRGQAWGLYGFILSFLHTNETRYLQAAKQIASYFIAHIPQSGRIPVDFAQPQECPWKDDIAACVAACGLLELARTCGDAAQDAAYGDAAVTMLQAIARESCDFSPQTDGVLCECSAAYHSEEHNVNFTYGDFFYLEALHKLAGSDFLIW